ncbi:TonB-dependent receptor [Proteus mirabilis]|uniref:TonB-dependent receptor n=1 Tax=Proteus mirabilis TaxID=584 RepID=UPI0006682893|nr:TonB-dependent receptor [Proteus mirabilis]KAB7727483.1 TonB-dependent receptor [Proteus mirabilis]MCT8214914.1 TonB-dependent receptor [Proteus mirabilis]MCZ4571181.1 TonB-dependent receptor [Proteus mirabilis]MCZ4577010.1 TonB-dependent receptor [Proteus mirabilis]MCZ4658525.1 TonB-dependent receptor [Proteus mirabilis]
MKKIKLSIMLLMLFSFPLYICAKEIDEEKNKEKADILTVRENKTNNKETFSSLLLNNREEVKGKKLDEIKANTIGNTVSKIAGVQTEGFGPNAARPIIRSLSGNRVGILVNNLPINDVSFISGNMPIPIDINKINEIAISKSSEALLYGGGSSGGAIHLWDDRIMTQLPEKTISGAVTFNGSTNNGNGGSATIKFSDQQNWVFHLSGATKRVTHYKIPTRSKAGACYSYQQLKDHFKLRDQCQVEMKVSNRLNPAFYPYISEFWKKNKIAYELDEDDKYTFKDKDYISGLGYVNNEPNVLYKSGSSNFIEHVSPPKHYVENNNNEIPNSFLKSQSGTASLTYINDEGYLGLSITDFQTSYGVPGYAYLTTKTSRKMYKPVSVSNHNQRIDIQGKHYHLAPFLRDSAFYYSYSESKDEELVGQIASSIFDTQSHQLALETAHSSLFDRLTGAIGVNANHRDLKTSGYDAYLPSVLTKEYGFYWIESLDLSPFEITAGYRRGYTSHHLNIPSHYNSGRGKGANPQNSSFNTSANTLALSFTPIDEWTLKLQKNIAYRAPEINELYTHGPHFAYLIEEQGDGKFNTEKSNSIELSSVIEVGNFSNKISVYKTDYRDFKFRRLTGVSRGGVTVMEWDETDLETKGLEYEFKYLYEMPRDHHLTFTLFGDFVENKSKRKLFIVGNYLPNLPNEKHGINIHYQYGDLTAFGRAIYYKKQKESGGLLRGGDLIFPSYTLVDAGIGKKFPLDKLTVSVDVVINNLTNVEARPASSQLKYLAPLPGRNYGLNVKVDF